MFKEDQVKFVYKLKGRNEANGNHSFIILLSFCINFNNIQGKKYFFNHLITDFIIKNNLESLYLHKLEI
jgi:hypothetical protein